nr:dihydroxyacetone kinase subunit DhaL [uncultured Niameybacter sp.]
MNTILYEVISEMANVIQANKDSLTELDKKVGDGDHGINMARGFAHVMEKLHVDEEIKISDCLKKVGMTIVTNVGGVSGQLYGSAFLKASMAMRNRDYLDKEVLGILLRASLQGIKERGKVVKGDKTIIDALEPAYEAYIKGIEEGKTAAESMKLACEAAEVGVEDTKLMIAKRGRTSYVGEQSMGNEDPGAKSTLLMLQAIAIVLERQDNKRD